MSPETVGIVTPRPRAYLIAGSTAVAAALSRMSIAAAYAVTGLGAAGDRSFGSFSGLTFAPSCLLIASTLGMHWAFSARLNHIGRAGLLTLGLGFGLSAVGQFGGEWLGFPRSGNWLILPGTLLTTLGLVGFAFGLPDRSLVPRAYPALALSIAALPLVFVPAALMVEALRGRSVFPPTLHDNYFTILYVLGSVLWLALGVTLLRDGRVAASDEPSTARTPP